MSDFYERPPFGFSDTYLKRVYTVLQPSNFYNLSPLEMAKKYNYDAPPTPVQQQPYTIGGGIPGAGGQPGGIPSEQPPQQVSVDKTQVRTLYDAILKYHTDTEYPLTDADKQKSQLILDKLLELYENPYKPNGQATIKEAQQFLDQLKRNPPQKAGVPVIPVDYHIPGKGDPASGGGGPTEEQPPHGPVLEPPIYLQPPVEIPPDYHIPGQPDPGSGGRQASTEPEPEYTIEADVLSLAITRVSNINFLRLPPVERVKLARAFGDIKNLSPNQKVNKDEYDKFKKNVAYIQSVWNIYKT